MYPQSSLTQQQRGDAVVLFEAGHGHRSTASRLGIGQHAARELFERWKLHGREALVQRSTKQKFSFEMKREVVLRFIGGEGTSMDLARAYDLSSHKLVGKWAQVYRDEGEEGLRPKPRGRRSKKSLSATEPVGELDRLRAENERLRAEVAYLGKLRALRDQKR